MLRWLANVFRLGIKELASLGSDTVLAVFIVYSFTFSVYSVATGIKTEVANAPVAVVDADRSTLSGPHPGRIAATLFPAPRDARPRRGRCPMDRGAYTFVLDIPPRFEADVLHGRSPALQLNIDATAMTQAGVGAATSTSIVQQETQALSADARHRGAAAGRRRDPRAFFNPNLEGDLVPFGDGGAGKRHHAVDPPRRRGGDPRARARHHRAPAGDADPRQRDRLRQDLGQRPRDPAGGRRCR